MAVLLLAAVPGIAADIAVERFAVPGIAVAAEHIAAGHFAVPGIAVADEHIAAGRIAVAAESATASLSQWRFFDLASSATMRLSVHSSGLAFFRQPVSHFLAVVQACSQVLHVSVLQAP